MQDTANNERYQRGLENLKKIDAEAGEKVVKALGRISPDFARFLVEYPFGDVYEREGLDLRSREIATIAALAAMGNATPQLKVHIEAGLNVGITKNEILEILIQMSVYAGFPSAINGLLAAQEVFDSKNL